jgi:hypothetical protein
VAQRTKLRDVLTISFLATSCLVEFQQKIKLQHLIFKAVVCKI